MMRSAQELASTAWGLAKLRKPPPSEAWSADFLAAASKTILGEPTNQQQQQRENKKSQPWSRRPRGGSLASSGKGANGVAQPISSGPSKAASPCSSGAHALSITLYSVALMKLRPDQGWLMACLRYTTEHFNGFTIQVKICYIAR